MVNANLIKTVFPNNKQPEVWANTFNDTLPHFGIDTRLRVCAFLAQTGHESNGFTALSENLNYSAQALRTVFKKYFPNEEIANRYARKPVMIANRVYANRMGNGSEESGDGWKFRGRGILQVTGRDNYTRFSDWYNIDDVVELPDLLAHPKWAVLSALWFWEINKLNALCDTEQFVTLTKRINGGTNGLAHRQSLYNKLKGLL